jgi:biopolymer transport protein ExbD
MIGRGSSRFESTHIDMVPMVDCIMVLLIFLMISSAFVHDPGIEVQKPDVAGSSVAEQNILPIAISADDRIYFDGQQVRPDQVADLIRQAAVGRSPVVIIRADRACTEGVFAEVYAAAKQAGIGHVEFATTRVEGGPGK